MVEPLTVIVLGGQPLIPQGVCPDCGGDSCLCAIGPGWDRCYFVCGLNYDNCGYSGPIYESLQKAWDSPEVPTRNFEPEGR